MAKLGYSSITLTDLTETIPVTLLLESNQSKNIQIKTGNLYTPDFAEKTNSGNYEKELIITPSLFIGQKEVNLSEHPEYKGTDGTRASGFIYYTIGGEEKYFYNPKNLQTDKLSGIYVDENCRLCFRKNLSESLTIKAFIEDFQNTEHGYTINLVQASNPINFAFLDGVEGNYHVIVSSYDKDTENHRQHFEDGNDGPLLLNAVVYNGSDEICNTAENQETELWDWRWYKMTEPDVEIKQEVDGKSQTRIPSLEITRDDVFSEERIICKITDLTTEKVYIGSIDLWDLKEDYDCVIQASTKTFNEETTSATFQVMVYDSQGVLIEEGHELFQDFSYQWGTAEIGETGENLAGAEGKQIEINFTNFKHKNSFVLYCNVSIKGRRVASEIEVIQFATKHTVQIDPANIFVSTLEDGSYGGPDSHEFGFTFKLLDSNGVPLPFNEGQGDSLDEDASFDGRITFDRKENENTWNFNDCKLTIGQNGKQWIWANDHETSRYYEFDYIYRGQVYSSGLTLVKNVNGRSNYNIFILSSSGNILADGDTSTNLTVYTYYASQEIEQGLTYEWKQDNKEEVLGTNKTIKIDANSFTNKTIISCTVSSEGEKIGEASYTLIDQTDNLPFSLVLSDNLSQNVQIKTGDVYEPNFSTLTGEKEIIIKPSLFLGRTSLNIPINTLANLTEPGNNNLYYEIYESGGKQTTIYYKGDTVDVTKNYVDRNGFLHLKENLADNITIEAYIENYSYNNAQTSIALISATNPISILFLEEGRNNFYALIEAASNRTHFEDSNAGDITLTAYLYQGKQELIKDNSNNKFSFQWNSIGTDSLANRDKQSYTVSRSLIQGRDLFTCTITDKTTGLTYSASQLIQDFTDDYECRIIPDKPLLLNQENTTVNLTASLWNRNTGSQVSQMDGQNLSFDWFKLTDSSSSETSLNHRSNTLQIKKTDYSTVKVFSIICRVKAGNRLLATNLVTFQVVTEYIAKISPQNFFIQTDNNGKIPLSDNQTIQGKFYFTITDGSGKLLSFTDTGTSNAPTFSAISESGLSINVNQKTTSKWDYEFTFTFNKKYTWGETLSKTYEFTYQIWGQIFTEEINIIKIISGEKGQPGAAGYTVDLSNEFHAFEGGEAIAEPGQSTNCEISAFFSAEGKKIAAVWVGNSGSISEEETSDNCIYTSTKTKNELNYNNNGSYLRIKAQGVTGESNKVLITLRTNDQNSSNFLTKNGSVNFYIRLDGMDSFFLKTFKYIINYSGKSFYLSPSSSTIRYIQATRTYEPTTLSIAAYTRKATGTGEQNAAQQYSSGTILYSTDKTNWKKYNSALTLSGLLNGSTNLYIRLFSASATLTSNSYTEGNLVNKMGYLLDEDTIPILTSMEGYVVGGENLLKWSRTLPVETGKWTKSSYISITSDGSFSTATWPDSTSSYALVSSKITVLPEYVGKTFCLSFYVNRGQLENSENLVVYASTTDRGSTQTLGTIYRSTQTGFTIESGSGYVRAYCIFNLSSSFQNGSSLYIRFVGAGPVSIKKPKLEVGSIPSDWSASLYDTTYEQGLVGNNLLQNSLIFDASTSYKHLSQVEEGHTYTISFATASNSTTLYLGFSGSEEVAPSVNAFSFSTSPYTFTATDTHVFIKASSITSLNKLKLEMGSSASSFILTETEIQQINSSLQQTVDGIYTSMYDSDGNLILINSQELQDKLKDSLSGVNSKIVANETTIAAVQTQYAVVDGRIQDITNKVNINDFYDLNGDGRNEQCITISTEAGVLGSTRVIITSERLGFVRNDEVIAYISGQKLFITSAEITTSLKIGTKSTTDKSGSGIKFIPSENGVAVIWE